MPAVPQTSLDPAFRDAAKRDKSIGTFVSAHDKAIRRVVWGLESIFGLSFGARNYCVEDLGNYLVPRNLLRGHMQIYGVNAAYAPTCSACFQLWLGVRHGSFDE